MQNGIRQRRKQWTVSWPLKGVVDPGINRESRLKRIFYSQIPKDGLDTVAGRVFPGEGMMMDDCTMAVNQLQRGSKMRQMEGR